jgi:hypothetical protein
MAAKARTELGAGRDPKEEDSTGEEERDSEGEKGDASRGRISGSRSGQRRSSVVSTHEGHMLCSGSGGTASAHPRGGDPWLPRQLRENCNFRSLKRCVSYIYHY